MFYAAEEVKESFSSVAIRDLGTEVDLIFGHKINDEINFNIGYSHMFGLETLKGGSKDATSNWAWAMIAIKPVFFKYDHRKKE